MEFFEGWKALNSRFDSDNPTAMTQLIGYKLLAIDNERHHPDEFSVSNRDLMKRTGIQSTQTIHAARNTLKQMGLIDFETPKGKPTQYRWTINQTPIKHLPNTNQTLSEIPNNACAIDVIDVKDNLSIDTHAEQTDELDALLDYWAHDLNGGRLSVEHQSKLSALLKAHGLDWLKAAMKEAADANNNPRGLSPKFLFSVIAR
ncbi:MAG: hypothetical protein IKI76_08995, partial [Selenomonadaceae bacterium]|nr:hypothetical protein [Selenomonadaceae bacterium]